MRRFVDLHTHSTASDGTARPNEVIALADRAELAAVALTDHDTTSGLAEARQAARQYPELRFIGGVEVSAQFKPGTMHILGLAIDEHSKALQDLLGRLVSSRNKRNLRIIEKLRSLGVDITIDDVNAVAMDFGDNSPGTVIGRVHIAEAIRRKGFVRAIGEAFERYIGNTAPAYVEKDFLAPADVIAAIHDSAGLAVLAHPVQLHYSNNAQLERVLRELLGGGLDGIEAYHSSHSPEQIRLYIDLAKQLGLGVTGGSDFHGVAKPGVELGKPRIPLAAITGAFAERLFG